MPLVSVIVPVFNNHSTIMRALDSVMAQTVGDLEVIVIDDGSADLGFQDVAEAFGENPRFKLIGPRVNTGPSIARNVGIDASSGDWIALLDGDDAWRPERLAHLLALSQGADFVADNLTLFDSGAQVEMGTQFGAFDTDILTLEDHLSAWPGAASDTGVLKPLMRKAFLDQRHLRYDPALRCGEDFILYAAALAERAVFRLTEHADYIYTAPYGAKSRSKSPHTRTVTDGGSMAVKLRALGSAYKAQLTPVEQEAIEEKAASLEHLTEMWEVRVALMERNFGQCLRMLSRNAYVRGRVRDALARRLLGPFGPVKQERIVAHKANLQHRRSRP